MPSHAAAVVVLMAWIGASISAAHCACLPTHATSTGRSHAVHGAPPAQGPPCHRQRPLHRDCCGDDGSCPASLWNAATVSEQALYAQPLAVPAPVSRALRTAALGARPPTACSPQTATASPPLWLVLRSLLI